MSDSDSAESKIVVTLLGTGTPLMKVNQRGPSTLVQAGENIILFDCGRCATMRIAQAEIPVEALTHLFLTHLHSDHLVGLPDLWLTGWELGRVKPLRLIGPRGTVNMATHLVHTSSI